MNIDKLNEYNDIMSNLKQQLAITKGNILRDKVSYILDTIGFHDDYVLKIEKYGNEYVVNLKIGTCENTLMIFKKNNSTITMKFAGFEMVSIYSIDNISMTNDLFKQFISIFCKYVFNIDINNLAKCTLDEDQKWFMKIMEEQFYWIEKSYDIEEVFTFDKNWAHFGINDDSKLELMIKFNIDLIKGDNTRIFYYIKIVSTENNDHYTDFRIEPFGYNINGEAKFKELDIRYFPDNWDREKAKEFLTDVVANLVNGTASPYWYFEKIKYEIKGVHTIFGSD